MVCEIDFFFGLTQSYTLETYLLLSLPDSLLQIFSKSAKIFLNFWPEMAIW